MQALLCSLWCQAHELHVLPNEWPQMCEARRRRRCTRVLLFGNHTLHDEVDPKNGDVSLPWAGDSYPQSVSQSWNFNA